MACVDGSGELHMRLLVGFRHEFYERVGALHSSEVCASQVGKDLDVSVIAQRRRCSWPPDLASAAERPTWGGPVHPGKAWLLEH